MEKIQATGSLGKLAVAAEAAAVSEGKETAINDLAAVSEAGETVVNEAAIVSEGGETVANAANTLSEYEETVANKMSAASESGGKGPAIFQGIMAGLAVTMGMVAMEGQKAEQALRKIGEGKSKDIEEAKAGRGGEQLESKLIAANLKARDVSSTGAARQVGAGVGGTAGAVAGAIGGA